MFHAHPTQQVTQTLISHEQNGLSLVEARRRLEEYGTNTLPQPQKKHWLRVLADHFKDVLLGILFLSAMVSFVVGDWHDGVIILLIILANGLMGFFQEQKADHAIDALKKLSVSQAKVIREGVAHVIPATDVVPGDLLLLETGDKIPADARLVESAQLKVSESMLTGESKPIEKDAQFVGEATSALGDRFNMVYRDTSVLYGRGKALVTATGQTTEIGKISQLLQKQESKITALNLELNRLGKRLTIFAGMAAVCIFLILFFFDSSQLRAAFLTAISLAIAVVPEGIPAVVTTVLAISVGRLARKQAVIRKLSVIEVLGSTSCILTDKTGTLTKNEMSVSDISLLDRHFTWKEGILYENGRAVDPQTRGSDFRQLILCAVLCNDATRSHEGGMIGDPMEVALVTMAQQAGYDVERLRADHPRIFEIPFSSETKRMTVVVRDPQKRWFIFTKGACESVCRALKEANGMHRRPSEELSAQGIRSLVYSCKQLSGESFSFDQIDALLKDQDYLGTIGCKDPLRPEVKDAIAVAASAGIKTIMITGDHRLIARSIGQELGLIREETQILNATELEGMSEEALTTRMADTRIFSRVSPEQKLQIVKAAMRAGETVVVTGDGVNDAPAIKTADIGVAMGKSGTDVAREAADVVLQDDNYATIVEAIRQGRGIFVNFTKFLMYQVSCNFSGVLIIFPLTIITGSAPLLPIHILLLNLISETGPCIALGLEKPEQGIMQLPPRKREEGLLNRARWIKMSVEAALLASVGIGAYVSAGLLDASAAATSAVLTTAFLSRLWHSLSARSETVSAFSRHLRSNVGLWYTVLITMLVLVVSLYTPLGNQLTKTSPLPWSLLLACVVLSGIPFFVVEVSKFIRSRSIVRAESRI